MDARAWGIEPGYRDVRGKWWKTSRTTQSALLEAMGASVDAPPPSPVRVVLAGRRARVGDMLLETEDGGQETIDGFLPPDVPIGYHRLRDEDSGASVRLIVSPARCFLPADLNLWGWAVQTYALRSRTSWGIGDLGDLASFNRWAAETGAGACLVNPLHSGEPYPFEDSPYYPGSRLWRNPLYLRLEEVPEAKGSEDVRTLADEGRALNVERLIDRAAVHRLKMQALDALWSQFEGSSDFDAYCALAGRSLTRHATFISLAELNGEEWQRWPVHFRDANSAAVERFTSENLERVRFHMWVQWLLDRQFADAASQLPVINDLAVGVNPAGADAWMNADCFASGVSIGAPPDDFNLRGQGWGVTTFDPWKLQSAEYRPFIETIRASARHAGGLRYDHVMGLFRLFWIPEGAEPRDGAYVRYPHSDLLHILAVESHRAQAVIIGEDLGTVESDVRNELAARAILSYKLMYFESDAPDSYPECALASITNHDLPTLPGLLSGDDLAEQKRSGVVPNEDFAISAARRAREIAGVDGRASVESVVQGCYGRIARSRCHIVAATLEDALGVKERPNIPGTTGAERPNWRLALPLNLEEIEKDPRPIEIASLMRAGRERSRVS